MIRVVSWDVDGTLFSYSRLLIALLRLTPRKLNDCGWTGLVRRIQAVTRFHREVEAQRHGCHSRVDIDRLREFESIQLEEKAALAMALCMTKPRRSALDILQAFRAEGIPQVVLSDFECDYKLKALGLTGCFARTYSCRALGFWKPSPLPFEHVQRDFGIRPAEHLHIGDRNHADGWGAGRSGCRFVNVRSLKNLTKHGFLREGNVQSYLCETYRQAGL